MNYLTVREEWRDHANCKGLTHLFFPPAKERPQARVVREEQASAICAGCSVRLECEAASSGESGFWAGRHLDEGAPR